MGGGGSGGGAGQAGRLDTPALGHHVWPQLVAHTGLVQRLFPPRLLRGNTDQGGKSDATDARGKGTLKFGPTGLRTASARCSGFRSCSGWCRSAGCQPTPCVSPQPGVKRRFLSSARPGTSRVGRPTHRYCKLAKFPKLLGMVPVSWLTANSLCIATTGGVKRRSLSCARPGTSRVGKPAHSVSKLIRFPKLLGMVPLSWLLTNHLRGTMPGREKALSPAHARALTV